MLQTIQVLTDPSDVGPLDTLRDAVGTREEQGLEVLVQFDAHWVVESSKLSLGVLEAPVEFGVLSEPSLTEPRMGLVFRNAMLGSGDPAVELLDGRLPVSDPVPLGPSRTPTGRLGDATPPMSLAPRVVGEVQPMLGVLALAAGLVEIARGAASGGLMPPAGAADEVVTAPANAVEIGACGGELGGDVRRRMTFERLQLGEQSCATGFGVLGQRPDGGIDADGRGNAGDPLLVTVERPVMRDVLEGLAEVVGDGVDDAGPAGAGHGDVGELAATALGQVVGAIRGGALLAVHGQGVAVVKVVRVEGFPLQHNATAVVGRHRQRLGPLVDGDDAAALAGDQLAVVVGGESDDGVADGVAAAVGGVEVGAGEPAALFGTDTGEAVEVGDTPAPASPMQADATRIYPLFGRYTRCPRPRWPKKVLVTLQVVETMGLEPTTPCLQSRCSSQLSYVPEPAPAGLGTTSVPIRRHRPKLAACL